MHCLREAVLSGMSSPPVKLLSAWFCPYAQRAWIALEEKGLKAGVDYEVKECMERTADGLQKEPLLLQANPKGLVPVLLDQRTGRIPDPSDDPELGTVVRESLVCMEYIDEAFETHVRLLPTLPGQRAKSRVWLDEINTRVCGPFYRALSKPTPEERRAANEELIAGLAAFAANIKGPFFLGEMFTAVDIAIIPWILRLPVLGLYRNFSIPETPEFEPLRAWMKVASSRPSVVATLADEAKLNEMYKHYATP